ncbi:putative methyltransferase [Janibacter sp. HTCC2649]|uniref:MGMT family protein n=1 Tax=Janibacter sp. HTCC2649 TaxID=313589 RepID=UPI000066EFC4|nr:MGMT family protein [Janibacter sp. HTCC2649]EAP96943.1 putative methyltransferase [Janibacter sp. HTCC2649]
MASELTIERVLTLVELVPRGRVVSYGDLGKIVGIGPRQVGSFMRHHSEGLPWWRITNAAGDLPAPLLSQAHPHWTDEGILVKRNGLGCRIADYRADLHALEAAYRTRIADTLTAMGTAIPHTSNPAARALTAASITTLEELSEWRRADVAERHGMGPKALRMLDEALTEADLEWKP